MTPESGAPVRRCAVLGSPISHSLSPALHRAAYRWLGLEGWSYDTCEVTADGLAGFVAGLDPSWRGFSLTMPLKVAVMELGAPDETAHRVGVANTLIIDPDGHRVANTDVPGLVSALRRAGVDRVESAVILGAGATARSSLASVAELGAQQVTLMARRPEAAGGAQELAERIGVGLAVEPWDAAVPTSDLLLATTVAGAADARADAYVASAPVIFDAIYDPWPTVLARTAEAAGRVVVAGLDLLAAQAALQLDLMTGRTVPVEVLLDAGRAELAHRLAAS